MNWMCNEYGQRFEMGSQSISLQNFSEDYKFIYKNILKFWTTQQCWLEVNTYCLKLFFYLIWDNVIFLIEFKSDRLIIIKDALKIIDSITNEQVNKILDKLQSNDYE